MSYTSSFHIIKLCHDLFYCQLIFFTCFNPSDFCVEIKHCSLEAITNTKWKSKNLWIFYHKGHGCPSANRSNSAVWVGTWKHLRNAIVRAVKEWGLDSPSAFVPVATTHRKNLLWSGIQFFVNKPTYSGLVLCTVPFTEPFHTPAIAAISPNPPPHFFWPSYTS